MQRPPAPTSRPRPRIQRRCPARAGSVRTAPRTGSATARATSHAPPSWRGIASVVVLASLFFAFTVTFTFTATRSVAAEGAAPEALPEGVRSDTPIYSPAVRDEFPRQLLFGDTHLHTRLSQDAYSFGVTLGSDEAYRFAKGEIIEATHGQRAQLDRPLDFLVIADHANGMGSMDALVAGNEKLLADERLVAWRKLLLEVGGAKAGLQISEEGRMAGWPAALNDPEILAPAWRQVLEAAERHNIPGQFSALIGYEWTSWPGGSNLHRVVVFRDDAETLGDFVPFSSFMSDDPEDLWAALGRYETASGGRVLAIPHNGNLSNGLLYDVKTLSGRPIDADYARRRARWEPIAEVTQIKGDGEAHPFLSPDDEFADYETWDMGNFAGVPKRDDMLQYEYARAALKSGLGLFGELGVNPFRFGMIGSTDSHTALATAEEDNFFGKHSAGMEPSKSRARRPVGKSGEVVTMGWQQAASGYAAVWARENTRQAVWDAMARKEVYATTGPRIALRFFGGWSFAKEDASASDPARIGYAKGVPMGGDLGERPRGRVPSFLISAQRDALGANLDRIQVVKGWRDRTGQVHERVFDVAWSNSDPKRRDRRRIRRSGKLDPVGNTVDRSKATYTNEIGAAELSTVWLDPDFDPTEAAFYYVRVLEIPTPRWTDYDARVFGGQVPEAVAEIVNQERAYSSPIWYEPKR